MNTRRLLLSPLVLLIALAAMLGLNASSAAAGGGPETRVRAFDHATVDIVAALSSETAGSVGCLRPETGATAAGSCVATEAVDDLLPGLPSSAPKPLGLGSTGRVTPANLTEQLAMTEVMSAPGGQIIRVTMTDSRWPAADGWVKMAQNVNGVQNTVTGAVDDFKFAVAP